MHTLTPFPDQTNFLHFSTVTSVGILGSDFVEFGSSSVFSRQESLGPKKESLKLKKKTGTRKNTGFSHELRR